MNSIKALKRTSSNKENKSLKTQSCLNLKDIVSNKEILRKLKRCKSVGDLPNQQAQLKFESVKSERNLSILYTSNNNNNNINNLIPSSPFRSTIIHNNTMDMSCYSMIVDSDNIKVPIVGYEIVAERNRFTIFKLRIENYENNNFWLVLRRFTDFTRLQTKLKTLFPHVNLTLPKKKWFGNNFSSAFLDQRVSGLQNFINTILNNAEMRKCSTVREFFCLDEPPSFSEEISEDCRMVVESQNETIAYLQLQLRAKDETIANLTHSLKVQKEHNDYLSSLLVK